MMADIKIRKAIVEDAAEIANVHTNSWREAYKGMLPEDFLDARPLSFKNCYHLWQGIVADPTNITLVAECSKKGIIGFINGEKARDIEYKDYAEVCAFYVFQKYHGQKIGLKLLKEFFDQSKERGFSKAYLWVLKDNPTINFYEKAGGHFHGHSKEEVVAKQTTTELCYLWESIDLVINK